MRKIKIVTDSSSDVLTLDGVDFESAPLKIVTGEKVYLDDASLDVEGMVNDLATYKGKSSTSCPNPDDYLRAFGDADEVYCVTITGSLSGSYNSALVAKNTYEKENPTSRVYVLNSLSTGPEMALIIERMRTLILEGHSFDSITAAIDEYTTHTGLFFVLESMRNLANNGRVSHIVAKLAGMLGIRVVGRASDRGDLEMLSKPRGERNTLTEVIVQLRKVENRALEPAVGVIARGPDEAAVALLKIIDGVRKLHPVAGGNIILPGAVQRIVIRNVEHAVQHKTIAPDVQEFARLAGLQIQFVPVMCVRHKIQLSIGALGNPGIILQHILRIFVDELRLHALQ